MRRRCFLAGASSVLLFPPISLSAETGAVATGGDRFLIGEQEFILADIRAPSRHVLGKIHAPFFVQAKQLLQNYIEAAKLEIEDAAPKTRWNARIVKAYRSGSAMSLQEYMVSLGAARVAPQSDEYAFIDHLFAVERLARDAGIGMWSLEEYRVFDALNADAAIGGYHLIEGLVKTGRATRNRFYLNFGDDYRTDFTASATSSVYRLWNKDGFDLVLLEGKQIRVRGFVIDINGPSIDLTHRRQIEFSDTEEI